MSSQELGELIRMPKYGKTLHRLIHQFPRLQVCGKSVGELRGKYGHTGQHPVRNCWACTACIATSDAFCALMFMCCTVAPTTWRRMCSLLSAARRCMGAHNLNCNIRTCSLFATSTHCMLMLLPVPSLHLAHINAHAFAHSLSPLLPFFAACGTRSAHYALPPEV